MAAELAAWYLSVDCVATMKLREPVSLEMPFLSRAVILKCVIEVRLIDVLTQHISAVQLCQIRTSASSVKRDSAFSSGLIG